MNLNGAWEFEFDDANVGAKENWPAETHKFSKSIAVPYCFESSLSGIGDPAFHPYVWYRRSLMLPVEWGAKRVLLHFGAVDYEARVWINGRFAGGHRGGQTPFRLDITDLLNTGQNSIVVRAEDQPEDRYMPRGKQYWEPKSKRIWYTRTTGIWQPAWLGAAGSSFLEKVNITPSNDGIVRFDARVTRFDPSLEFHAAVREGGRTVAAAMGTVAEGRAMAAAVVRENKLWSPDSPNLYDVTFEIRRGAEVVDRVQSYFGFRTVGIRQGRVAINGRPLT